MSSSIGPARAALYSLLAAAANTAGNPLRGVQIAFGPPDQFEQQEVVGIVGIRRPVETAIVLGPQPNVRDEQYNIEIAVESYDPAGTSQSVDARCCAMYEAVREVVLSDPTLQGVLKFGAFPTGQESDGPQRPRRADGPGLEPGWVMRLDLLVECRARA